MTLKREVYFPSALLTSCPPTKRPALSFLPRGILHRNLQLSPISRGTIPANTVPHTGSDRLPCPPDGTCTGILHRSYVIFPGTSSRRDTLKTKGLDQRRNLPKRDPDRQGIRMDLAEQRDAQRT